MAETDLITGPVGGAGDVLDAGINYWRRRTVAPATTPRPELGHSKGMFHIMWATKGLEFLWRQVERATRQGYLGYYAGIADDGGVVSIHVSNAEDETQYKRIEDFICDVLCAEVHKYDIREIVDQDIQELEQLMQNMNLKSDEKQ